VLGCAGAGLRSFVIGVSLNCSCVAASDVPKPLGIRKPPPVSEPPLTWLTRPDMKEVSKSRKCVRSCS